MNACPQPWKVFTGQIPLPGKNPMRLFKFVVDGIIICKCCRALRSIVISEWTDSTYSLTVPVFDLSTNRLPGLQTLGQFYASFFSIQWGKGYMWGGIGYLLGYAIILGPFLTAIVLMSVRCVVMGYIQANAYVLQPYIAYVVSVRGRVSFLPRLHPMGVPISQQLLPLQHNP